MAILYTLLAIFGVVFFESFFIALGGFRIFFLISLISFKKVNWKYLTVFAILTSLILDIIYHYALGTNLLIVIIPFLLLVGSSLFVPLGRSISGYAIKFTIFCIYYVLLTVVPSFFLDGVFSQISWVILGGIVIKSFVSIILCMLADLGWSRLRGKEENNKIRLNS